MGVFNRFRRLALLFALAVLAVGGVRVIEKNRSQNIALVPLALDSANPKRTRAGALDFLAAWELKSDNTDFGGISALVALRDGRFLGVSDAGALIGFGLSNNSQVDRPFIAALPGAVGKAGFQDRDSEGLTTDAGSGRIWISYEFKHAIRRMPASLSRVDAVTRPALMRGWRSNSGAEALVRLRDGRFLVFAEGGGDVDNAYPAVHFSGDPAEQGSAAFSFNYQPPSGYRPTDVTQLPDGRLLMLNRRISFPNGFTAKLTLFDPAGIKPGAVVSGQVIATLAPPLLVDNMEGITTTQENGRTIVWMVSDNNFNIIQRTLLMKFALRLPDIKKPEAHNAPGFESL
jgi:hypothetical protein